MSNTMNGNKGSVYNILFLDQCYGARAMMAHSIALKEASDRFAVFSAGVAPEAALNPVALRVLQSSQCPIHCLAPTSMARFSNADAPLLNFVFTLYDKDSGDIPLTCDVQPHTAPFEVNWRIEDPALTKGNALAVEAAYVRTYRYLRNRITLLANLPIASLDAFALTRRLQSIGAYGVDHLDAAFLATKPQAGLPAAKSLSTAA